MVLYIMIFVILPISVVFPFYKRKTWYLRILVIVDSKEGLDLLRIYCRQSYLVFTRGGLHNSCLRPPVTWQQFQPLRQTSLLYLPYFSSKINNHNIKWLWYCRVCAFYSDSLWPMVQHHFRRLAKGQEVSRYYKSYIHFRMSLPPRCFLYAVEHTYGHQLLYPPQQHPDTFFRVQTPHSHI